MSRLPKCFIPTLTDRGAGYAYAIYHFPSLNFAFRTAQMIGMSSALSRIRITAYFTAKYHRRAQICFRPRYASTSTVEMENEKVKHSEFVHNADPKSHWSRSKAEDRYKDDDLLHDVVSGKGKLLHSVLTVRVLM